MAMTEAKWLSGTRPAAMLQFLQGKVSDRKLRLFICACTRRSQYHFRDRAEKAEEQAVVALAERFADGRASEKELADARRCRHNENATWLVASEAVSKAAELSVLAGPYDCRQADKAALLRCIFGNPFRKGSLEPAWLTAIGVSTNSVSTNQQVRALAQTAYEERHPSTAMLDSTRLAILADALEEAGCGNGDLLEHLRGPGPHVRGCFAVDLILGKE